jgi:hypothetical protein
MVYGNGYMGVTEANYAVVLLHLITFAIRWGSGSSGCSCCQLAASKLVRMGG